MDTYRIGNREFRSRLWLGTSRYPSPASLAEAVRAAEVEIVTVTLRRENPESGGGEAFWRLIRELNVAVLPNTAGCRNAREAITTAHMAREIFATPWIKLEVVVRVDPTSGVADCAQAVPRPVPETVPGHCPIRANPNLR